METKKTSIELINASFVKFAFVRGHCTILKYLNGLSREIGYIWRFIRLIYFFYYDPLGKSYCYNLRSMLVKSTFYLIKKGECDR